MGKSNPKSSKATTVKNDPAKAIHTSMQPYHFGMDLFASLQNYNVKNAEFFTKRLDENLKTTSALLTSTDPNSLFKEASHWWQTMGKDYMAHFADGLELSMEVQNEVEELVETEEAIMKAKPQEMFENSPV